MTLTPPPDLRRDFEEIRGRLHDLERRHGVAAAAPEVATEAPLGTLIVASQMYGDLFGVHNWPGPPAPFDPYGSPWGGIYTRDLPTPQDGFGQWISCEFYSEVAGTDGDEVQAYFIWGNDPDVRFGNISMLFARDVVDDPVHMGVVNFWQFDSYVNWVPDRFEPTLFMESSAGWHKEGPFLDMSLNDDIDTADCEYSITTSQLSYDATLDSEIRFYHRVRTRNGVPETAEGHTLWIRPFVDQDLNAFVFGGHGTGHSGLTPFTGAPDLFFVTAPGDAVWPTDTTGPIFKDRTTGDFYRLLVDSGGAVSIEAV